MLKFIAALFLISLPALAEDNSVFEARKAEALKEIDQHISKLNEHKTCVSNAKDKESLKTCHEAMKDFRQDRRMEHMGNRRDRLDKKMEKLKEKSSN